jgi:hypothetical protein
MVAKVPEGVFRELLVERLAEAIRLPAARLRELWGAGDGRSGGGGTGPTSGLGALTGARNDGARGGPGGGQARGRAGQSAGRGGLMRQAVMMLVHYPPIAGQLEAAELADLEGLDEPGADILRALVADLRAEPCGSGRRSSASADWPPPRSWSPIKPLRCASCRQRSGACRPSDGGGASTSCWNASGMARSPPRNGRNFRA